MSGRASLREAVPQYEVEDAWTWNTTAEGGVHLNLHGLKRTVVIVPRDVERMKLTQDTMRKVHRGTVTAIAPSPSASAWSTEGMTRLAHPLSEEKLLGGNRVLTQKIAQLRESAQRQWESLHYYVETRTEAQPCGFCGSWGEHDNDSCDLVAVVAALEEDFGCGEHWRGETIPTDDEPEGGWARNADGSFMTPEQSDEGWAVQ